MKNKLHVRNKFSPNMPKVQCRRMPVVADNLRFINKDEKTGIVKVSGYAVKWDSINYHGEKFIRGAFAEVCAAFEAGTKKIHCYYNHGWRLWYIDSSITMRIGKYTVIKEDEVGLYIELEFTPGLAIARDVAAMVQHGTVDGFSIAFFPIGDLDYDDKGTHIEIRRADIYEISVVDEPSDDSARVINDQTIEAIESEDDAEELLRSLGLAGDYSKKLIARLTDVHKPKENPPPKTEPKKDPLAFLDKIPV